MSEVGFIYFFIFIWIAVVVFIVLANTFKLKSNVTRYTIISTILLFISSIVLIFSLTTTKKNREMRQADSARSVADGYTIDYYKVVLDVDESQNIKVNEDIGINFYETGHHGIYRSLPLWLPYTNKDNETISKRAIINNIDANDQFQLLNENSRVKIKIGDPNTTVQIGQHPYLISYNYNLGPDEIEGYDEFIYHLYGNYWGTEIKNASFEIHLPSEFDGEIHFYSDKYRKNDITKYIEYRINDNIIYAKAKKALNGALTVDIILPDGYFENNFSNKSSNYGYNSLFCCIYCFIAAIVLGLIWYLKGKDDKANEFADSYAIPGNLDPAQLGYIYKKLSGPLLFIAMVIQLSVKGYLTISTDENNNTIIKRKISDKGLDDLIDRKIVFKRIKSIKEMEQIKDINVKNFIKMFSLSENKDIYIIDKDFDRFYAAGDYLIKQGYIAIESDTLNEYSENDISNLLLEEKKQRDMLSKLTENEKDVYNILFNGGASSYKISEMKNLRTEVYNFLNKIAEQVDSIIYDISSFKFMVLSSFITFFSSFVFLLGYWKFEDMHPSSGYMYVVAWLSVAFMIFISAFTWKKSLQGENLTSQVLLFKSKLENTDPNYFSEAIKDYDYYAYSLIPYAYVFNIATVWSDKFKDLPIYKTDPSTYDSYYLWNHNSYSHMFYDICPPSSSSSNGCSSCGGGCSSCGGGCSSCGGGGSW